MVRGANEGERLAREEALGCAAGETDKPKDYEPGIRIPLFPLLRCPIARPCWVGVWLGCAVGAHSHQEQLMSKGLDRKREAKKKPQKSLQEKRAAKREKKQGRGFQVV